MDPIVDIPLFHMEIMLTILLMENFITHMKDTVMFMGLLKKSLQPTAGTDISMEKDVDISK